MKAIFSTLFVILYFLGSSVFAQDYVFKVLANKGANQVKTASSDWQAIKTGSTLNAGDEIKVSEDSYLGLVHSSGRTVELKKPEVIAINDLAATLSATSSSVASKYADFVLNKVAGSGGSGGDNLTATGAVTRATDNSSIKVFMPSSVEVLNPEALVQWSEVEGENSYVVTLKNMFDEVIFSEETSANELNLNLDNDKLKEERLVILTVQVKGEDELTSGDYGIQRLADEDAESLQSELNQLRSETSDETSLNHIMMASFYEKNNLMVDALTSYRKAIELSPDVDDFKTMYNDFIERNGLNQ